ncbi:hypothetical protein OY671_009659, partial [Metschnikowia pulcherrima]
TPAQCYSSRQEGTERPFTSPSSGEHRRGTFVCAADGNPSFASTTKFDTGTGWPSFWRPSPRAVGTSVDRPFGTSRTDVHCSRRGGHLAPSFADGPPPTGLRYRMHGDASQFRLA